MARGWWWRIGRGLLVAVVTYFVVGSAAVWVGQWVFRWRAERLLADAARLGRGPGSWEEFQSFQKRWGAWGSYRGTCTAFACHYGVNMHDWTGEVLYPAWLDGWKDPWKYSYPVEYAVWPVLRVSRAKMPWVEVSVQVVNGQATPELAELWMVAEQGLPRNWGFENGHGGYALVGGFRAQRGELKPGRTPIPEWPEAAPVKDLEVDKPSGCENCIAIYTYFDDKAQAAELDPLIKVQTSCITRWSYCKDEAEIMPAAWKRYDAEHAVQRAQEKRLAACDYPAAFLYQQAENAVLMQVTGEDDGHGGRMLRYVRSLKGSLGMSPRGAYTISQNEVGPFHLKAETVGEERVVLLPGRADSSALPGNEVFAYRCGVLPASAVAELAAAVPAKNDKDKEAKTAPGATPLP